MGDNGMTKPSTNGGGNAKKKELFVIFMVGVEHPRKNFLLIHINIDFLIVYMLFIIVIFGFHVHYVVKILVDTNGMEI
jgi:hypothetical protein